MLILTIRTDKPEAEIGLYDDHAKVDYLIWEAHRQLAETIHSQIQKLLKDNSKNWEDIDGIAYYRGPGSFTGLRIGASVANALASGLDAKVVAESGDDWISQATAKLLSSDSSQFVAPEYGQLANITKPKK